MKKRTKYLAVAEEIKRKIAAGDYPSGSRLPSKRVLADRHGVSLITAEHALSLLEEEGYLTLRERYGTFVREASERPRDAVHPLPHPRLAEPSRADARHTFESSVWFRTVRRVIAESGDLLFLKAPGMGCPVLRNAIADYLARYRGMYADPARILIGSGAEQLYEAVVKLLGREKIYGTEDPSYSPIRSAYLGMGAVVRPLPLGKAGIPKSVLDAAGIQVLHVTPHHSFPSGITTPAAARRDYLAWASAAPSRFIVEDDYDSEFFRPGHPIRTLYAADTEGRVLYLNTFSKSLSPAIRIGYLILPPSLAARADALFSEASCPVPVMDQYVLAAFLASGDFERHLNRERRKMEKNPPKKATL